MSFEFVENVLLSFPKLEKAVFNQFEESADEVGTKRLVTEIAAIHSGLTSNYNNYPADELEKSLRSWVEPYPKPIILNHDPESDPIGRIMAARMDKEADGLPFIRLQAAVISPIAVERVMDGRYITGSVGGKAESAKCSICNTDWAASRETMGFPCKHKRGSVYNGKICQFNLSGITWKEYSFVNIPADQKSGIRQNTEDSENWVTGAKLFAINMNEESIFELNEANEEKNILDDMKKKDAHFTYLNLKGTFLTTTALDFSEKSQSNLTFEKTNTTIDNEPSTNVLNSSTEDASEENEMTEEILEEDILSVSEQLTADLSTPAVESEDLSETELSTETDESSASADAKTDPEESTDEAKEEATGEDTSTEPLSETAEDTSDKTEESDTDKVEEIQEERVESDNKEDEEESKDSIEESQESDPKDELIAKLQEENTKLKKSLHFMLAERVVNAKINLGLVKTEEKADALSEHISRTPSSLADAIRDLEKMPSSKVFAVTTEVAPSLEEKTLVVASEGDRVIEDIKEFDSPAKAENPKQKLEDIFVKRLSNKR